MFGRRLDRGEIVATDERRPPKPGSFYRSGVTARVKWFDAAKGFGFVTPDDGSPDVFLHASALKTLGRDALPEGATVECDIGSGAKGPQVALIHAVDETTAHRGTARRAGAGTRGRPDGRAPARPGTRSGIPPAAVSAPRSGGPERSALPPGRPVEGTVKFFDPRKGYGFMTPERGGKDIFIGADALRRSGMESLQPNVRIRVITRASERGLEADRVEFP